MRKNAGLPSTLAAGIAIFVFSVTGAGARAATPGETKKVDPCSLLTKAEIQEILGKPVSDGKLNTKANAAVGLPCEFTVGDYGVVSILAVEATPLNAPDKVMAGLKKMNIQVTDAPGVGDRSFFADMGYGMLQLNTWKWANYLILTLSVPGATEAQQKAAAGKLMGKILPRL
jgi:hypothetical protein